MRLRLVVVFGFIVFSVCMVRANAQNSVFYVTNRKPIGTSFSGERNYAHEGHGLTYTEVPLIKVRHGFAMGVPKVISPDVFLEQVADAGQKLGTHEIAVFVHGYNQKATDAMSCGAQFEAALREPVVVFDWPSIGKIKTYMGDECNIEWSLRGFEIFMNGLLKRIKPENVMTISHSLGNRLVCWYLQSRYDKAEEKPEHLKEVVLTSPDVDRATFKNYFYKTAFNTDKLRIYVSNTDKPLRFSGLVHGGYKRLGAGYTDGTEDIRWKIPGSLGGAETINFTCLDSGWMGHSIQFDLIANMHQHQVPGTGLELYSAAEKNYIFVRRTEKR